MMKLAGARGLLGAGGEVFIPPKFARSTVARTVENDTAHDRFRSKIDKL